MHPTQTPCRAFMLFVKIVFVKTHTDHQQNTHNDV